MALKELQRILEQARIRIIIKDMRLNLISSLMQKQRKTESAYA